MQAAESHPAKRLRRGGQAQECSELDQNSHSEPVSTDRCRQRYRQCQVRSRQAYPFGGYAFGAYGFGGYGFGGFAAGTVV